MSATETFGIEVEIAPKGDAGKSVDKVLDGLETHAKKTGDAIERAIGGSMVDSAKRAGQAAADAAHSAEALRRAGDEASRAFAKASLDAHKAAEEEKEWASAIAQAKMNLLDQGKAVDTVKAGVAAYDAALAASSTTTAKAVNASVDLVRGWKDVTRTLGDVGNAINAIRQGIDLAKQAFETSKAVAREAAQVWKAAMSSGPGAFSPGDTRSDAASFAVSQAMERHGMSGAGVLPKALQDAVDAARSGADSADTRKAIAMWEAKIANDSTLDDAASKFRLGNDEAAKRGEKWAKENPKLWAKMEAAEKKRAAAEARATAAATETHGVRGHAGKVATSGLSVADELKAFAFVDNIREARVFADTLGAVAVAADDTVASVQKLYTIPPPPVGEWAKLGDALEGPLSSALDGVIDQIATMTFDLKNLFLSLEEEVARAIMKMLILQGLKAAFGGSGLGGGVGGFLWDLAGGGRDGSGNARKSNPGDPFGGAAGGSGGPVFREPVRSGGGGGQSERQAPQIHLKSVVVFNGEDLVREQLQSKEGERIVVTHVANNRGKLGR